MSDLPAGRGEYVTYREHIAAKEEQQKRTAAVEMEVATMRAALMHLPEDVRKLTDAVQALASKISVPAAPDPALTQTLLALQRGIDALTKQPQQSHVRDVIELLNAKPQQGGGMKAATVGVVVGVLLTALAVVAFS